MHSGQELQAYEYSLAVVLYQMLAGDLSRPLTTDWNKDIVDPLLRDDLARCFAGSPQDRFAGAGQLAQNLRSLDWRRAAEQAKRAAFRRGVSRTIGVTLALVLGVAALAKISANWWERRQANKAVERLGEVYQRITSYQESASMKIVREAVGGTYDIVISVSFAFAKPNKLSLTLAGNGEMKLISDGKRIWNSVSLVRQQYTAKDATNSSVRAILDEYMNDQNIGMLLNPKPKDLYGLQVDICARVMSLAEGDQILMTRSAFDNARQVLKGQEIEGLNRLNGLQWLNHGPYVLKGVEEPLEICEVGEAGQAVLKPPADSEKVHRGVGAKPSGLGSAGTCSLSARSDSDRKSSCSGCGFRGRLGAGRLEPAFAG